MRRAEYESNQLRNFIAELTKMLDALGGLSGSKCEIETAIAPLLKAESSGIAWGGVQRCLAEAVSRALLGRPALPPTVEEVALELAWMDENNLSRVPLALTAAIGVPIAVRFECAAEILAVVEKWKQLEGLST